MRLLLGNRYKREITTSESLYFSNTATERPRYGDCISDKAKKCPERGSLENGGDSQREAQNLSEARTGKYCGVLLRQILLSCMYLAPAVLNSSFSVVCCCGDYGPVRQATA